MNAQSPSRPDVYQQITDRIVAAIEAGAGKVEMPWHRAGVTHTRPSNVLTGNRYRGVNILSLWASAEAGGFTTGIWGTYRQWQAKGAQVRKGEKASLIVFYKQYDVESDAGADGDEPESTTRMFARASWVFNANQVDGFELPKPTVRNPVETIDAVERFFAATGADIRYGGESAYYRPSTDHIQMPDRERFTGTSTSTATQALYGVLGHEAVHWSGAKHRLNREFGKRFGDNAYAMEELVAELGAAFLCADLGISPQPRPDHAAYIEHWLGAMKADKKAIFTAASKASQAADYLTSLQPGVIEAAA